MADQNNGNQNIGNQPAGNMVNQNVGNQNIGGGQNVPPNVPNVPPPPRVTPDENNFGKIAPKFELGLENWELFFERFQNAANMYNVGNQHFKRVLYGNLSMEAFALACPNYAPDKAPYLAMSATEYAAALQMLFEPAAETEACHIEYEQREQISGEHPERYFRDKCRMFYRAFPPGQRDFRKLHRDATSGLINQEMKYQMRAFRPRDVEDVNEYLQELVHWSNVQRTRFLNGEISQGDVLGAEAHSTGISYRNYTNVPHLKIKNEVMSVSGNAVNAIPRQSKSRNRSNSTCYYCQEKGHYRTDCPRRKTGLDPVTALGAEEEEVEEEPEHTVAPLHNNGFRRKGNSYGRGSGNFRQIKFGNTRSRQVGRTSQKRAPNRAGYKRFNRRVAYIHEDADGNQYLEEIPDLTEEESESEGEEDVPEVAEGTNSNDNAKGSGVNAVEVGRGHTEEFSEADLIPFAFLGI